MKYIVTGNTMVTVSIEVDKLIGVNGNKESIAADAPVEFDDWIEP